MIKTKIQFILLSMIFGLMAYAVILRWKPAMEGITWGYSFSASRSNTEEKIRFGVYDPDWVFAKDSRLAIDLYYLDLGNFDRTKFQKEKDASGVRNRLILATVEPWSKDRSNREGLLVNIISGNYDNQINTVCGELAKVKKDIFVRFGHEMETTNGRYPWANQEGNLYIDAYRYFVRRCKKQAKESKMYFVWSPAGNRELEKYWPGMEYVDLVGISVFNYPQYDLKNYGHSRSFREIMDEKYKRIKQYNLPVMVTEFGVTGDKKHQEGWLREAFKDIRRYPLLHALIYFNSLDSPDAWGPDYPVPDWRITDFTFGW